MSEMAEVPFRALCLGVMEKLRNSLEDELLLSGGRKLEFFVFFSSDAFALALLVFAEEPWRRWGALATKLSTAISGSELKLCSGDGGALTARMRFDSANFWLMVL